MYRKILKINITLQGIQSLTQGKTICLLVPFLDETYTGNRINSVLSYALPGKRNIVTFLKNQVPIKTFPGFSVWYILQKTIISVHHIIRTYT